jgi:hypothetical protein
MQIIKDHATKDTSSRLQHANFNFAIIGEAIGNEPGIFELLHFMMTDLNMSCEFIKLKWHVLISKSEDEV